MKYIQIALISISSFLSNYLVAQTNLNHPTVADVKVKYKAAPQTSVSAFINGIPEATVTLSSTNGVSKVFLKIIELETNAVIYEVNYPISSGIITSQTGEKLFENNNGEIFISNGQALILKPYSYHVYTQDSQLNSTVTFSVIQ